MRCAMRILIDRKIKHLFICILLLVVGFSSVSVAAVSLQWKFAALYVLVSAICMGVLIFISFSIFRIPYAILIAVLTGVLSFIPYIGAFCACFIGALLVLMVNPLQALLSIIVYQVVQFIENQFIYPHVVGGSVGLAPLWTLVAVLIGGNLFGVLGMVFFIPLVAVLYQLVKEYTNKKQALQQTAAAASAASKETKADAEAK